MKSTGWHWSYTDPFPTGIVSAPIFVSWWMGLPSNIRERGFAVALAVERDMRNSVVLEESLPKAVRT